MNPQSQIASPAYCYTAAQIAAALRISKRNTLKALVEIAPCGSRVIHGNETAVWSFDILPGRIREIISMNARQNHLSIADYLEAGFKPWQPSVALGAVSESCLADARKLRAALLAALQRMDALMFTPEDRVRLGLEDYRREFGHAITERHWRRLLDRTLHRDGGAEDFERLEIYLPERPAGKPVSGKSVAGTNDFSWLTNFISTFADPAMPTENEKTALWSQTFELLVAGADTKRERKQLRSTIAKHLQTVAPWLAKTERGLRVSFDRKFKRWQESGGNAASLCDGRILKRGAPVAAPVAKGDIDQIVWHAATNCGGRVAQALRDFAISGERSGLTANTLEIITRHHSNKSQFNRRLTRLVASDVKAIKPFLLGKKAKDDATAHVERDYSKLASLEIINADDFTFPVYFYIPDGNGWFTLTRGQCLLMLDIRSLKIIAWSLQPERNYNSLVIRTLMNRVCAGWGIPGTWYFELGIWKKSHVVKGTAPVGWNNAHSLTDATIGWENLGVKFQHAIRARSKPVERVGGLLQDLMHGIRGYCGRDERRDCPEATKRAMDDVKFHRVNHPGELFLSFDEWHDQLARLIDNYNANSQSGRVLQGLCPDEAFEKYWPHDNPPARIDAGIWHLVAHYVRPVPVTTNGIIFRIGSKSFVYRNERTGQDRGKTVLAWFDPDCPEFLCVTDMNRKNPYLVERATPVDFLAAKGDPVFEREISRAASHSNYPRARFNVLKAKFAPIYRRNLVASETSETAQEMQQLRASHTMKQKEVRASRKTFARLGMVNRTPRPGQLEAAERLARNLNSFISENDNLKTRDL